MRHARNPWPARAKVGLTALGLGFAVVAGFTWGASMLAVDAGEAGNRVEVGPAASTELTPVPAKTKDTVVAPTDSIPLTAPTIEDSPEPTPEPIIGEDLIDPEWPVDTRGDGCTTPIWPAKAESTPRVLLIGDSLYRNARPLLEAELTNAGWAPTVRCWGARGTTWGVGQVERARELDQLPETVVVSLGTNDIWWLGVSMDQAVDAMMTALGPDITVYWINLRFGPHGYDRLPEFGSANEVLERKTSEYSNLRIIDFAAAFQDAQARGVPVGWLDGVHMNEAARIVRVEAIVEALEEHRSSVVA